MFVQMMRKTKYQCKEDRGTQSAGKQRMVEIFGPGEGPVTPEMRMQDQFLLLWMSHQIFQHIF